MGESSAVQRIVSFGDGIGPSDRVVMVLQILAQVASLADQGNEKAMAIQSAALDVLLRMTEDL